MSRREKVKRKVVGGCGSISDREPLQRSLPLAGCETYRPDVRPNVRALVPEWVSLSMQVSEMECEDERMSKSKRQNG
jgi:hypothetical protein